MELPRHFSAPINDRFVVEHAVGEGASGVVYRAFDLLLKRPIALKLFHLGAADELVDAAAPAALRAALAERALLGKTQHPGVVQILDAGMAEGIGHPYLVMEWIDGPLLSRYHASTPLPAHEAIGLAVLICRALAHIHESGVVHQDIKPSNIMLRPRLATQELLPQLQYEPVLIDFGIASATQQPSQQPTPEGPSRLPIGTPAYMSPEQARGDLCIGHRSDLYSLGATLFEVFVGRAPHQGASPLATLARLATTPAPRLSAFRPDLPSLLDDLVDSLLRTDASERPDSAAQVEIQLQNCLLGEARESFPPAEASSRLGSVNTRLVTTLVAMGLREEKRDAVMSRMKKRGALVAALGQDALVAHFGVEVATGSEARVGLTLGRMAAAGGARVGVASGRARVQGTGAARARPIGDVVDRAANLAREAEKGAVLSDATTKELGRGRFEFRVRTDGSAIVGSALKPSTDQLGGAPFVGRDAEMAQVLGAYERACQETNSMAVFVSGPPGIGKTRLQRESIARISSQAEPPRIIVQRSDSYAQAHVLGAAADILRSLLDLPQSADEQSVAKAIVEKLGPETMSELTQENQALLAKLLGGPGQLDSQWQQAQGARDALWLAMTDLVLRILSNEPVVLVAEDLQWADAESRAWIDHLLGRSGRHPLFLLACVRPSYWEKDSTRFHHRDQLRIDLRPVSPQAVRVIAESVLGEKATAKQLDGISSQAAGSPLFAEELARLSASGAETAQAPTIEVAIQASLDSLEASARDAVGRLSVLGLSCWKEALPALGHTGGDAVLKTLVAGDVLMERSSSRFGSTLEYSFKHALVRDVAYSALSDELKAELHALAGRWLAGVGEDAATVAGQLDRGGDHALAAQHWEQASVRALAANALPDAVSMAERALDFAQDDEESFRRASYLDEAYSRLDPRASDRETAISALERTAHDDPSRLRAEGARARYDDARGIGHDVSERLASVRDRANQLQMWDEVARCSATLAYRCVFAGDFAEAEQEVKRLLDLSREGVVHAKVDAHQAEAIIRQTKGAVSSSLRARKNAAQAARDAGLKEREAMLTTNLGFALSTVGARKEARDTLESGLILAENIGSPGATRHAQMNLLGWASLYGSDRRLDTFLSDTRAEADTSATGYWASPDRSNLGVLYYRGVELLRSSVPSHQARALVLLRMSAESYKDTGQRDVLPVALGMWAEAERICGDPETAAKIGQDAADLLLSGAPSLLNESPVFLTLYKARMDLGDEAGANEALAQSIHPLLRRLNGLLGGPYASTFLTQLPQNAELIASAEAAGLLPDSINRIITQPGRG